MDLPQRYFNVKKGMLLKLCIVLMTSPILIRPAFATDSTTTTSVATNAYQATRSFPNRTTRAIETSSERTTSASSQTHPAYNLPYEHSAESVTSPFPDAESRRDPLPGPVADGDTTRTTTTLYGNSTGDVTRIRTVSAQQTFNDNSKECEDLTESERATVVRFRIGDANLTGPGKWYQEEGGRFLEMLAHNLSENFNVAAKREHFAYIRRSGREQIKPHTLEVYIFVRKQYPGINSTSLQEMLRQIGLSNNVTGIPWPYCSSLFYDYLALWIVLMVVVFLMVVASIVLTWHCWKRGKSVDLKTDITLHTSSRDESSNGQDNPALVVTNEENPPKKRAALPPSAAADVSTEAVESAVDDGFDTAIVPYNSLPTPNSVNTSVNNGDTGAGNGSHVICDTKL